MSSPVGTLFKLARRFRRTLGDVRQQIQTAKDTIADEERREAAKQALADGLDDVVDAANAKGDGISAGVTSLVLSEVREAIAGTRPHFRVLTDADQRRTLELAMGLRDSMLPQTAFRLITDVYDFTGELVARYDTPRVWVDIEPLVEIAACALDQVMAFYEDRGDRMTEAEWRRRGQPLLAVEYAKKFKNWS